jgi:hypothetical protein
MVAHRSACAEIIARLRADGGCVDWSEKDATEMLWAVLSFETWNLLTGACAWTAQHYRDHLTKALTELVGARSGKRGERRRDLK